MRLDCRWSTSPPPAVICCPHVVSHYRHTHAALCDPHLWIFILNLSSCVSDVLNSPADRRRVGGVLVVPSGPVGCYEISPSAQDHTNIKRQKMEIIKWSTSTSILYSNTLLKWKYLVTFHQTDGCEINIQ